MTTKKKKEESTSAGKTKEEIYEHNEEVIKQTNQMVELDFDNPEEALREIELAELKNIRERSIVKINSNSTWEHSKILSRRYFRNKDSFRIFISKGLKLMGKVTHKDFDDIQKISLVKVIRETIGKGEDKEVIEVIRFFDEDIDKRILRNITESYDVDFWIYKFKSEDKEYILLVDKDSKLDYEEYNIEGTLINLPDYADVGKYSKLLLQRPLILLHSAKKRIPKFKDNEEFFDKIKQLKLNEEDNLRHFIFGGEREDGKYYYHSPKEYEDLITAILFSCSKDGYPLHFLGIGKPGCGKSTSIENLHSKTGEQSIFEGSTSTFKLLIPSYKGTSVKIGYLFEAVRFCFTDEFLRLLIRVDREDRPYYLTYLNDLLEHKRRIRGSGNCSFEGKMSSKFIGVTNPVFGTKNIISLVHKFEESITTLSRMLIFYYDQEHSNFVNKQKNERTRTKIKDINHNDFLGIYDYLYAVECKFDNKEVRKIFDKIRGYLEANEEYSLVLDMFEARYNHHIDCLLDGIIKNRCILELNKNFEAKKADYEKLEEMLKYLLKGWNIDITREMKVNK